MAACSPSIHFFLDVLFSFSPVVEEFLEVQKQRSVCVVNVVCSVTDSAPLKLRTTSKSSCSRNCVPCKASTW